MDYGAPIQGHGYSSAKHGLVTLTRAFLFSAPYVFDSEGIKCYALAPTGCDTNLVRSLFVKVLLQLTFSHNSLVFMYIICNCIYIDLKIILRKMLMQLMRIWKILVV